MVCFKVLVLSQYMRGGTEGNCDTLGQYIFVYIRILLSP